MDKKQPTSVSKRVDCFNIFTTWSTECPTTLSAASMGTQPWLQVPQR